MDRPGRVSEAHASSHPGAFHYGPGHLVMYANPAFEAAFGRSCLGQPAREVMLDLPAAAFEVMDLVYRDGKPLARTIKGPGGSRRIVVAPRVDPESGEVYGVVTHLV
jgi:PAS domain-containing protein